MLGQGKNQKRCSRQTVYFWGPTNDGAQIYIQFYWVFGFAAFTF